MKELKVYMSFDGRCKEALDFYSKALGGEIVNIQTFGESPMETPPGMENHIMHSEFKAGGIEFMASDSMPGSTVSVGDNVSLTINLTDAKEQEDIFNSLSEGGTITMPLQDTFWGAKFGMVTDKFGTHWLLNRETGEGK